MLQIDIRGVSFVFLLQKINQSLTLTTLFLQSKISRCSVELFSFGLKVEGYGSVKGHEAMGVRVGGSRGIVAHGGPCGRLGGAVGAGR